MPSAITLSLNPLVNPPALPYGAPAWDKIKIDHFLPAIEWAIEKAHAEIAVINAIAVGQATFANTVEALTVADKDFVRIVKLFSHLAGTMANQTVRDIQEQIDPLETKFNDDINLDADLFARIAQVRHSAEGQKLQGPQAMLLKKTYEKFVRAGALLNDGDKVILRGLNEKLQDKTTQYQK